MANVLVPLQAVEAALDAAGIQRVVGGRPPGDKPRPHAHQRVSVWAPTTASTKLTPSTTTLIDTLVVRGTWQQKTKPDEQEASRNDFLTWQGAVMDAVLSADPCAVPLTSVTVTRTEDETWLRFAINLQYTRTKLS